MSYSSGRYENAFMLPAWVLDTAGEESGPAPSSKQVCCIHNFQE
jgi:hypothetical protein